MGFIRLTIILLVALSVLYVVISLYSRSVRKEWLERQWDEKATTSDPEARRAFIADGLAEYRSSLRRRLILLVYVIPVIVIAAITYFTNAS